MQRTASSGKQNNCQFLLKKQSMLYQIPLGKNNGPFLSKDIMHSNPKSITLLTGAEVLRFHSSMVNTLQLFQDKSNAKSSLGGKPNNIQNFNSTFQYLGGEMHVLAKDSENLKSEERKLRKEIEGLHEAVNRKNAELIEESMPILKNFMKKVKENGVHEAAELYKMSRQLEVISQDRAIMLNGIKYCAKKINDLENELGSGPILQSQNAENSMF